MKLVHTVAELRSLLAPGQAAFVPTMGNLHAGHLALVAQARAVAPQAPVVVSLFVNRLNGNNGEASVTFSDLNEDLWSGGADISYRFSPALAVTGKALRCRNRPCGSVRYACESSARQSPIEAEDPRRQSVPP